MIIFALGLVWWQTSSIGRRWQQGLVQSRFTKELAYPCWRSVLLCQDTSGVLWDIHNSSSIEKKPHKKWVTSSFPNDPLSAALPLEFPGLWLFLKGMTHPVNKESSGHRSFPIHSSKTIKSPVAVAQMSSLLEDGILADRADVTKDQLLFTPFFYWLHRHVSYLNFLDWEYTPENSKQPFCLSLVRATQAASQPLASEAVTRCLPEGSTQWREDGARRCFEYSTVLTSGRFATEMVLSSAWEKVTLKWRGEL